MNISYANTSIAQAQVMKSITACVLSPEPFCESLLAPAKALKNERYQ